MKIFQKKIDKSKKLEHIDIIPENNDDIYTLYNVINTDDHVEGVTSRKVELRPKVHTRITMKLRIKTETMHADLENGILCIKGKVQDGNDYVLIGQYHTIEIGLNQKLRVYNPEYTLLLRRSISKKTTTLLFLIVRQKEVIFLEMTDNLSKITTRVRYKGKNFKIVAASCSLEKYKLVAIIGENNTSDLQKTILNIKENKIHEKKIILVKHDELEVSPEKIVNTIINDTRFAKQFDEIQFVKELKELSIFFELQTNSELTCVGYKEVTEAVEMGALKKLFITNKKLKSFDVNERKKIEELCGTLERHKIPIYIIPSKHANGEKLDCMGGMSGILKYCYKDF